MIACSTILIVDDHAPNRELLSDLLQNADYRLVEAVNGHEAIRLAEQCLPDLILLDVMMPGLDGFEVCRHLRANPKIAEVPVVMVTALGDRESRIKGIGCGADEFITKPFDRIELRTRVRTLTQLNRFERLHRERAKVEEATQTIREQAALIDLATDAIVVLDLAGHVTSWNPGAANIFGISAAEALGRPLSALISKGESARLEAALRDTPVHGEWRGDLLAFHPQGNNLIIHSHWTLLRNPDGTPRGFLTVSTDQTEFKKLQAQLYRAQRIESLGSLAGGIAHDLNNMLAPVLMAAEVLQTQPPSEIRQQLAQVIHASAQRGAGLVRQILAFARGSDGSERTALQLAHLLKEILTFVRETFPKTITITDRQSPDLLLVHADATQIHQVLLNLLVNARDAMDGTGAIALTADNLHLDEAYATHHPGAKVGPYVVLRVTDNGCGMTPEILAKIWNPFFTSKPPGKGTGIGLSTVANIVKEHAGFVEVQSAPGHGTTFSIFLPATGTVAPAPTAVAPPLPLGQGERVLVIDDEAAMGRMMQALLTEHNYTTVVTDGPATALNSFTRDGHFDLVLVDFNLPMMDGSRLAKVMHNIKPSTRIILVTAAQNISDDQIKTGQFAAVVPKPFTAETLLVTMDRVLHGTGANGASAPLPQK